MENPNIQSLNLFLKSEDLFVFFGLFYFVQPFIWLRRDEKRK